LEGGVAAGWLLVVTSRPRLCRDYHQVSLAIIDYGTKR
jgi:hypothetical protein